MYDSKTRRDAYAGMVAWGGLYFVLLKNLGLFILPFGMWLAYLGGWFGELGHAPMLNYRAETPRDYVVRGEVRLKYMNYRKAGVEDLRTANRLMEEDLNSDAFADSRHTELRKRMRFAQAMNSLVVARYYGLEGQKPQALQYLDQSIKILQAEDDFRAKRELRTILQLQQYCSESNCKSIWQPLGFDQWLFQLF